MIAVVVSTVSKQVENVLFIQGYIVVPLDKIELYSISFYFMFSYVLL